VATSGGEIEVRTVVVAAGPFQVPHIPGFAATLDPSIEQIHVHDYRSPGALPPGGVLLVGSGQSGVQLAEELIAAGRTVTMAVGKCGRFPRTYRGRDVFWWLRELAVHVAAVGVRLPTPADLPSPRARLNCNPQLSGHGARHDTNLREMAANGLRLAGRLEAFEGTTARFADDLRETLTFVDAFFDERFKSTFDTYAERAGLDLPLDSMAQVAFDPVPVQELDLVAEGIATVIWTSGYRPDFAWLELPVIDEWGLPIQTVGWTDVRGLGFIGTPWLVDMASANLIGLERDAVALVEGWPGN
jgi:putative flavoprotein involved in K+ transport